MKASEFDQRFDDGESVIPYADMAQAERPNQMKRVNVDFPVWMLEALDKEARHLGVTRQSLVKIWLANCLNRDAITAR